MGKVAGFSERDASVCLFLFVAYFCDFRQGHRVAERADDRPGWRANLLGGCESESDRIGKLCRRGSSHRSARISAFEASVQRRGLRGKARVFEVKRRAWRFK